MRACQRIRPLPSGSRLRSAPCPSASRAREAPSPDPSSRSTTASASANSSYNNKYNTEVKRYKPTNNALNFNETNKSSGMHNYLQANFYTNSESFNQGKYMLLQSHVKATTVKASMLCAYFRVVLQPLFKKASMSAARIAKLAASVSRILGSKVRAARRLTLKNVALNDPVFRVTNDAVKYGRAKPAGRQVLSMFRPKVPSVFASKRRTRRSSNRLGPYNNLAQISSNTGD